MITVRNYNLIAGWTTETRDPASIDPYNFNTDPDFRLPACYLLEALRYGIPAYYNCFLIIAGVAYSGWWIALRCKNDRICDAFNAFNVFDINLNLLQYVCYSTHYSFTECI